MLMLKDLSFIIEPKDLGDNNSSNNSSSYQTHSRGSSGHLLNT